MIVNEQIVGLLPGDYIYSIDSVVTDDEEETNLYPLEFLLTLTGMSPHILNLKVNSIVMSLQCYKIN